MTIRKFWPLDLDPEGEIYENVAWDLPGYRKLRPQPSKSKSLKKNPTANGDR